MTGMPNYFTDSECRGQVDLTNSGEMYPGAMTITRIIIGDPQKRGLGFGSALLKRVCAVADLFNQILCLEINPYGPLDYDDLEAWYIRYGFYVDRKTGILLRMPGAPIRPVHEGFPV